MSEGHNDLLNEVKLTYFYGLFGQTDKKNNH